MEIRFEENHKDKKWITYKAEGDISQEGALCQDSFTYHIFMRNVPTPPKYTDQGLYHLYARAMALFDVLN